MSNLDMVLKIANINQKGLVKFEKDNFGRINKTGNNAIKVAINLLDRKDPNLDIKDQIMFNMVNSKWAVRIDQGNGFADDVLNGVYYEYASWIIHNKVFSSILVASPNDKVNDCFVFVETNARTKVSFIKLHSVVTTPENGLPAVGLGWGGVSEERMEKVAGYVVNLLNRHL